MEQGANTKQNRLRDTILVVFVLGVFLLLAFELGTHVLEFIRTTAPASNLEE